MLSINIMMDIKNEIMLNFLNYYFKIFGNPPISLKIIRLNDIDKIQWICSNSKVDWLYNSLLGSVLSIISIIRCYHNETKLYFIKLLYVSDVVFTFLIILILMRFRMKPKELNAVTNQLNKINQYVVTKQVVKRHFLKMIFIIAIQVISISCRYYQLVFLNDFPKYKIVL